MLIPPVGPKDAKIVFVGEAPGEDEVRLGEPFVGASGTLLTRKMHEAGILRQLCYITNVVKERPRNNNIKPFADLESKYPKTSLVFDRYVDLLKEELERIDSNVIVAVGNVSLYALTGKRGILKYRGSILESTLIPGRKVIPIIHPAGSLRNYIWQHYTSRDLLRIFQQSKFPEIRLRERELIIAPSYKQVMEFITECITKPRVAFDIETPKSLGKELSCISFAWNDTLAISIPFMDGTRPYFTRDQEAQVMLGIASILEDPNIESLGQNTTFDASYLYGKYGIKTRNIQDTMVAAGTLYPEFDKDLGFLTSIYTDVPYYKDEGKAKFTEGTVGKVSDQEFWQYNAKDSLVLNEIFNRQLRELEQLGNLETYRQQVELIEPLLYLSERGIKMKKSAMKEASLDFEADLIALEDDLADIIGERTTSGQHAKLKEFFYGKKKNRVYTNKDGNPTTNEGALKRLVRANDLDTSKAASILLDMRKKKKIKGTYYDMRLGEDNRMRCSMNPVGTKFGRLSSSKTLWGTGGNLQNQPPEMKKYMLPDLGYVGFGLDLGQAENRIVAYYGPDERMMEAFETNMDVHALTASFICGMSVEEVIYHDKMYEETKDKKYASPIGSGRYTWRFWGKKANHGFNYDLGYKAFAYLYEIPERDGKLIWEKYRTAYSGVSKYHRRIQEELKKNRILTNLYGRRIFFLDRWGDQMFKEGYSAIPQSTVADKINREGVKFAYYRQDLFPELELLSQVHDSLGFQIPISAGWERIAEMLLLLKANLEQPLECHGRRFIIPADIKMHPNNFGKGIEFKGGLNWNQDNWDVSTFAGILEENYYKEVKHAA